MSLKHVGNPFREKDSVTLKLQTFENYRNRNCT